jgi:hypothetical protein
MVGMGANGERYAIYSSYQYVSTGKSSVSPAVLIPIVGPLIGTSATAETTTRPQTLQVLYAGNGVVKDFEFLDNTQNTTTNTTGMNQTITTTTPTKQ